MDKQTIMASAAAALFALASAGGAAADSHGDAAETGKYKCMGGNGCKGQGECHTASHDCGGKNSCKGKGWVYLTPEECEAAGGELGEKKQ